MRHVVAVLGVIAFASGCATTQLPRAQIQSPGQLLFNGYANPEAGCHGCHGGDAAGTWKGPDLSVVKKYTDEEIIDEINEGPSIMPSYKDKLSDEEKQLIVQWLRERFPASGD